MEAFLTLHIALISKTGCDLMARALNDMKKASMLCWYTGLSPLKFDKEDVSLSKTSIFKRIIYVFFLTSIAFFRDMVFGRRAYEGQLSKLVIAPVQCISCVFIFLSSLYALSQVKKFNDFLQNIGTVDAYLRKFNAVIPNSFNFLVPVLTACCVSTSLMIRCWLSAKGVTILYAIFQHMAWYLATLPINQLRGFLLMIHSRMQAVLAILREAKSPNTLFVLTICHSLIVRSAEQLNDAFSFLFFSIIQFIFVLIIGELYSLYFVSFVGDYLTVVNRILWMYYVLMNVIPLVSTCDSISKQTQEFYVLQYRLMIHDKSGNAWPNSFMSLYTCLKKGIRFSAYGVFNLNNKLLKKITVAILTNLIILIQVSQEIPHYPENA